HSLDDLQQVGGGGNLDTDIDRALAVEADLGLVVIEAKRDVGYVLQPNDCAARLLQHQVAEFIERMDIRRGGQIKLHHLTLGVAEAGNVVVRSQRLRHIGGSQPVGRELFRIEPGTQREMLAAQDL